MKILPSLVVVSILAAVLLLSACGSDGAAETSSRPASPGIPSPPAVDEEVYTFNQLLDRDAIRPVYEPEFVSARETDLRDEQLVLGVAINGEARAYPIAVLNSREMVNDELAGIPILATW